MRDIEALTKFRESLPIFETRDDIVRACNDLTEVCIEKYNDDDIALELIGLNSEFKTEVLVSHGELTEDHYTFPIQSNSGKFYGLLKFDAQNTKISIETKSFLEICTKELARGFEKVQRIQDFRRDQLTGAFVREYIEDEVLPDLRRSGDTFGFLQFDIDDFSQVNNHHGHDAGDAVLKNIVKITQETLPESKETYVSRMGGEEFAVIVRDVDENGFEQLAENIAKNIREMTTEYNNKQINVTISGGVAHFPSNASSLNQIYKKADNACYKAKVLGKNKVIYAENLTEIESASKHHVTKMFKKELGDIYENFEMLKFNRTITIQKDGYAQLEEIRTIKQKSSDADGFPIIIMTEGDLSDWHSKSVNIKYVAPDTKNSWIIALEIPEYVQQVGEPVEIDFSCSLGQAYPDAREFHTTDLSLYNSPISIEDTIEFPDERPARDVEIQEYSIKNEDFTNVSPNTLENENIDIKNGNIKIRADVVKTPAILRTVWDW